MLWLRPLWGYEAPQIRAADAVFLLRAPDHSPELDTDFLPADVQPGTGPRGVTGTSARAGYACSSLPPGPVTATGGRQGTRKQRHQGAVRYARGYSSVRDGAHLPTALSHAQPVSLTSGIQRLATSCLLHGCHAGPSPLIPHRDRTGLPALTLGPAPLPLNTAARAILLECNSDLVTVPTTPSGSPFHPE